MKQGRFWQEAAYAHVLYSTGEWTTVSSMGHSLKQEREMSGHLRCDSRVEGAASRLPSPAKRRRGCTLVLRCPRIGLDVEHVCREIGREYRRGHGPCTGARPVGTSGIRPHGRRLDVARRCRPFSAQRAFLRRDFRGKWEHSLAASGGSTPGGLSLSLSLSQAYRGR